MAIKRTLKSKQNPHYGFLVSWQENQAEKRPVKRESKISTITGSASVRHKKNADSLAKEGLRLNVKKDIVRSLITISLVLILELMVYLAWIKIIR